METCVHFFQKSDPLRPLDSCRTCPSRLSLCMFICVPALYLQGLDSSVYSIPSGFSNLSSSSSTEIVKLRREGFDGNILFGVGYSKVSYSLHNISPLHHSIIGTGRYFASYQKKNINTIPVTDSLVYNGVLPARHARAIVAQSLRE